MGKAEAGTPKAIANASKAKGLQRLRFYCQVCQKQCRDENAFKQHSLSEGHVRQMLVVGEHANSYVENYSKEFLNDFIQLLSRRWGTKRVRANQVYQELIQDKHHTHMNSTKWVTLTGFVQYLGKNGMCHVDETEKGWFIAWIDNSPKALARQDAAMKKERQDLGDEERMRRMLKEQMERAKAIEEQRKANGDDDKGDEKEDEAEEEELDVTTIQPIKIGFGLGNGKGKEAEHSNGDAIEERVEKGEAADNDEALRNAAPQDTHESQAVLVSAAPVVSTSLQAKPRVNPLKMGGSKSNPLRGNPLKSKTAAVPTKSESDVHAGTKRPLSAMEAIAHEEQERRRRKGNAGWSGRGGHIPQGSSRQH